MKLWITGRCRLVTDDGLVAWDIMGVFSSEALAVAACRSPDDFIGPLLLNVALPEALTEWPGARYPLADGDR